MAVIVLTAAMCSGCGGDEPPRSGATRSAAPAPETPSPEAPQSTSGAVAVAGGLFTAPQPWTADVSGSAPSERSSAIISTLSRLGGWGNGNVAQTDFSLPVFVADGSTPRMPVVGTDDYCFGGPDCDPVPAEMPVPEGANIEGSADLTCDISGNTDGQGDFHLLVVERDEKRLYEVYQGSADGETLTATGLFTWNLDQEYPPGLRGDQCTSADAAGLPIAALTPTADEVAAGSVDHALRFILPNDRMKEGVYVAPATHAGGPESTEPDAPPYGVRFRLKADVDESGYSDGERTILAALKKHGMLLSDGGEIALTFADDRTSTAKWADLGVDAQSFTGLRVEDFEIVDLGPEIPLTYDCVRTP
jgi:serine/threonine-protein kinase